jgi:hypothetical protein
MKRNHQNINTADKFILKLYKLADTKPYLKSDCSPYVHNIQPCVTKHMYPNSNNHYGNYYIRSSFDCAVSDMNFRYWC